MIFSSNKKIHYLHIKGHFVTKNSFVVEVTFKVWSLHHFEVLFYYFLEVTPIWCAFVHYWFAFISFSLKGIVKWVEPCKCDILLVSRILWHRRMEIFMFGNHWQLSTVIAPYEFTECHSSEGCLFSSEKTFDVEC